MSTPTILLVGGAWHTADYLKPLATALEAADYSTITLALPSVGANPSKLDFGDDVALIRSMALNLAAEGKDIVAVLHSFGGVVGTEALQGLGELTSSKEGTGVVLGLVYIASMLPKKGDSAEAHVESVGNVAWKAVREALTVVGALLLPYLALYLMVYCRIEWDDCVATRTCRRHVLQ